MVTVHDVARAAGVSIATVSRALREPDRVSRTTRDRVLAAASELNYRPNRAARGLRGGRTGVIGLVVPDIENPYFAALTKGAQAAARSAGYGLVVVDTTESPRVELEEIRALMPQVDGVVIASSRLPRDELATTVDVVPTVSVNRDRSDLPGHVPGVTVSETAAGDLIVDHLVDLGHREVLYVAGPRDSWSNRRRWEALGAAATRRGAQLASIRAETPDAVGGREIASAAFEAPATAVIAFNDLVAVGILARWIETGISVPAQRSLASFDDTYVTELVAPHLTSVGPDQRRLGATAIEVMISRINALPSTVADDAELAPYLTVRSSTAPAPTR